MQVHDSKELITLSILVALNALLQPNLSAWINYGALQALLYAYEQGVTKYPKWIQPLTFARYVLLNSILMLRIDFPFILVIQQHLTIIPMTFIPSCLLSILVTQLPLLWSLWAAFVLSCILFIVQPFFTALVQQWTQIYLDGHDIHFGFIPPFHKSYRNITHESPNENGFNKKVIGITLHFHLDDEEEEEEEEIHTHTQDQKETKEETLPKNTSTHTQTTEPQEDELPETIITTQTTEPQEDKLTETIITTQTTEAREEHEPETSIPTQPTEPQHNESIETTEPQEDEPTEVHEEKNAQEQE